MKRFLTAVVLLLAVTAGIYGGVYYWSMDLRILHLFQKDAVSVPFRAEGKELQIYTEKGYETVLLRGVEVSASIPGYQTTSKRPKEEDYLRWFTAIGEMGANAVRAETVMDDRFYNALYTYNTSGDKPLYLLQGIGVLDAEGNGSGDAREEGFYGSLVDHGRIMVDVVHGRKNLVSADGLGGGIYRRDISRWVAGFLVGAEWFPDTISYTDHRTLHPSTYQGTYFKTTEGSTIFEAVMAQVMDEIASYESNKYRTQRPVGFLCDPACDFLDYQEVYARQLQKHAQVDPEHVVPTEAMEAGRFAAYRLFDFCEDFSRYLEPDQKRELAPLLFRLDKNQAYGGYLQLLARYHTMPLVAGYACSSARGAVKLGQDPLTEKAQGEQLAGVSRDLEEDGWAGGFVATWQDEWERVTWNTAFALLPDHNDLWHDLQTEGQNYGLMAFVPGDGDRCIIDGDPSEWSQEDIVCERGDVKLGVQYDAEGLYLLLEGLGPDENVYVPIDLSAEVGSSSCSQPELSFQREADFLLCLDGKENSRLLVQERYDAHRENFLLETKGQDAFILIPEESGKEFVPVEMALKNPILLDELTLENRTRRRLGTWEAGRLLHGSQDLEDGDYHSLTDFCWGEQCVEIRLPWLLLNVGDPAGMAVHRDYYHHYGVEFKEIKKMWMGLAGPDGGVDIPMEAFALKGWKKVEFGERLKESYYIMQAQWKGEDADGAVR